MFNCVQLDYFIFTFISLTDGLGVKRDYKQSLKYFGLASQSGNYSTEILLQYT